MLNWETIIDTTPDEKATISHLAEEPNSVLWQYYIENDRASDRGATISMGDYSNPPWGKDMRHLTTQKVRRIGIKHFPQIGAIGFWTLLYEERSKILAPIHGTSKKYAAPNLNVTEKTNTILFKCTSPKNIQYICYRIILRLDQFAVEYITYEDTIEVPKPETTGTYDIYCVGYIHEGEAVSEDSNHTYLDIVGTREDWPGPMEGSDLYITDVEVTDENKVHIQRSDGFQKDSDNPIPVPVSMTFLKDGKLQMTLNTGEVVTSSNSSPSSGSGSSLYSSEEVHF